jgi:hypothetical protein
VPLSFLQYTFSGLPVWQTQRQFKSTFWPVPGINLTMMRQYDLAHDSQTQTIPFTHQRRIYPHKRVKDAGEFILVDTRPLIAHLNRQPLRFCAQMHLNPLSWQRETQRVT